MEGNTHARRNRLVQEQRHDVYRERAKPVEPTVCPECKAVFQHGRWAWHGRRRAAHKALCPACRRMAEHVPAGLVELTGPFIKAHHREVTGLVRHVALRERRTHPLERIMALQGHNGDIRIETTGMHLAGSIGKSLARSYKGALSLQYADQASPLRVHWER